MYRLILILIFPFFLFSKEINLILDWNANQNYSGIYVALENGYYSDFNIDLNLISGGKFNVEKSVAFGRSDIGTSYQSTLMKAYSEGMDEIISICKLTLPTDGFISKKEKNILSPKDFEGKTYGGWGGQSEKQTIRYIMKSQGVHFNKLKFINVGSSSFLKLADRIDFMWVFWFFDGIYAAENNIKVNFIPLSKYLPKRYSSMLIANKQFLASNSSLVKKFLKATEKGYRFAIKYPEETSRILMKYNNSLKYQPTYLGQVYLNYYYLEDNVWGFQKNEYYEEYTQFLLKNKIIQKPVNYKQVFTNKFLE